MFLRNGVYTAALVSPAAPAVTVSLDHSRLVSSPPPDGGRAEPDDDDEGDDDKDEEGGAGALAREMADVLLS